MVFGFFAVIGERGRDVVGCVEEEGGARCEGNAFVGWAEENVELRDGVCRRREGKSTAMKLEEELGGKGRVRAILRMRDLITWLEEKGRKEELENMKVYFEKYGAKN